MYFKEPSLWRWLLMMFGGGVLCMGLFVVAIDETCHRDIVDRQPVYPGAEIVEAEHNFIRLRAMGRTRLTLSTPDDIEVVRQWFRDRNLELLRSDRYRGLAALDWRAEPDENGSLLFYTSSCSE
jgi:hypothetical protein